MSSFRFEAYENLVTKHHLGSGLHWSQAARWAFNEQLQSKKVTVASVKQIDADTVEIVKRKEAKPGRLFRYLGVDQQDFYERVTINRKDGTTAIDRIDGNWWHAEPFIGRRDLFYPEQREGRKEQLAFVRHNFWSHKLAGFQLQFFSNFSAWSYRGAFKKTPAQ